MHQWIFSVEFNIPTDTPGDGSVPAVQGHSKKRLFGRKYITEIPRSTLFIADMVKKTGIWWISGQRWSHSDTVLLTENPVCPLDKWLQQLMISRRWRFWNSNLRARLRCKIISLFGSGFSDDKIVLIDEPELGLNPPREARIFEIFTHWI